jgi:hypothetical protein
MSRHPGLYQLTDLVTTHFPNLSQPQASVLALWAFGMVLADSCGQTRVAAALAPVLGQDDNPVRQRLREFYQEADAKAGPQRTELAVTTCFGPWRHWILEGWRGQQLAVALDAMTLGRRFTVLAISVVYRGCAVPVAWKILPATEPGAWQPHWLALLEPFRGVVPEGWAVLVLTDRGLYAKGLFEAIQGLGWHPLRRINRGGTFRPEGWKRRVPLAQLGPRVGTRWPGRGEAFQDAPKRLRCTLLAVWEEDYAEPWLVVTDLPPQAARACWYGLRAWIEQGFKRTKSGGWQWQRTRMTDPARAERLGLALATWWLLVAGGEAEAAQEVAVETLPPVPPEGLTRGVWRGEGTARQRRGRWRLVGVFLRGRSRILAALLLWQPRSWGCGRPEPWPELWTQEEHALPSQERVNNKTLPV